MPILPVLLPDALGPSPAALWRARMIEEQMARRNQSPAILPPPKPTPLPPVAGGDQGPAPWQARLFGGDPGMTSILGPAAMRSAGSRGLLDAGLAMMAAAGGNGSGYQPGLGQVLQSGMQAGQQGFQAQAQQVAAEQQAKMQAQLMQLRQDAFARHPEIPGENQEQTKRRLLNLALDLSQAGDTEGAQHIMSMISGGAFNQPVGAQAPHQMVEDASGQYLVPLDRSGLPQLDAQGNPVRIKLAGPKPPAPGAGMALAETKMDKTISQWTAETKDEMSAWDAAGQLREELTNAPGSVISGATIVAALGRMAAPNNAREVQFISRMIQGEHDQQGLSILKAQGLTPLEKIERYTNYLGTKYGNNVPWSVRAEYARLGDALLQNHGERMQTKAKAMLSRMKSRGIDPTEGMSWLENPYADNKWHRGYLTELVQQAQQAQGVSAPAPSF